MALSELERQACDHVANRAKELYANLETAVAIPTGMDHAPGLDLYRRMLVDRLKAVDAKIEKRAGTPRPTWMRLPGARDESDAIHPIVIARHQAKAKSARILLAGHIDTVHDPHGSFQTLTRNADGKATGPGAADMKGGIEVALAALEALHLCGVDLTWTFVLNSDEETGTFQSAGVLRDLAKEHDVGLAMEPALPGGALAIERMGSGQFMIEVLGRAAHAGRDFAKGVSAVNRLAELITAISKLSNPSKGTIVNIGPLTGGEATNIVPDHACCWGNVRYADVESGQRLAQAIDEFATPDDAMPRVVVRREWNRPAKPKTPEVERLANLARSVAEALGQNLPFGATGGVCDGNILQEAGLPTIDTLGVRGGNLHRTDEFIEVDSIVERAQLMAVLLMRSGLPAPA